VTVRVIVADDQTLVRAGLAKLLDPEEGIAVVGEASNGSEAVDLTRSLRPDVVLMDIRMPNMDGLEATRRICQETEAQVLIITTYDLDEYVFEALRAGASGFLLKDAPAETLIAGVLTVSRGDALLAPSVTRRLIAEFTKQPPGEARRALPTLSGRETEVLTYMAHGESNAEIAQRLFLAETTVKSHVSSILLKLGCRDRVQAVVMAFASGVVSPDAV
jgi:DNA-binding NarL/FixJ family response regulator